MKNKIITKQCCLLVCSIAVFMLLPYVKLKAQQPFPIEIDANGGKVFVESMDIGPDGDIYVTGSIKNYVEFRFGAFSCGDGVVNFEPSGGHRIFVARLHADPVDLNFDQVVWMTIGTSTLNVNTGGIFSGKDIEVDPDGVVYFTGTLIGEVEFTRVIGGPSPTITSCHADNAFRHFVGRLSPNGAPNWISDTDPGVMMMNSYGEGLTLDRQNNRLFTGGYIGNATSAPMIFNDGTPSCNVGCGFTIVPTASPYVGFVTQYSLGGVNRQAFQIGEKIMALDMDNSDLGFVWATGSAYSTSSDVLLARIPVNLTTPMCANFPPMMITMPDADGDIGLDIAYTSDNQVAITGAFETVCSFPPLLPIITPPGHSDLFVAVFDNSVGMYTAATSTSSLSPFSATTQPFTLRNSCIAADPSSSSHLIIGYDKDAALSLYSDTGYIITKELTTALVPPPFPVGPYTSVASFVISDCLPSICPPVPVNPGARAMEIEYGNMGSFGNSYLAGDYNTKITIGGCTLNGTGSWNDGYVGRIEPFNDFFFRKKPVETSYEMTTGGLEEFAMYPNPAGNELFVKFTLEDDTELNTVNIYDLNGRLIYQKDLVGNKGENTMQLDLGLADGTYVLQYMKNNNISKTEKLVIINNN